MPVGRVLMQVLSCTSSPPCDPGLALGGRRRLGQHPSDWIAAGNRPNASRRRVHASRPVDRTPVRPHHRRRSSETVPVRDLRGGSRRAARTHRYREPGPSTTCERDTPASAADGHEPPGRAPERAQHPCCPVPPHRPSLDVAPPCVVFVDAPPPPRRPIVRTAVRTAARASSSSTWKAAAPIAPSAGTNAACPDPGRAGPDVSRARRRAPAGRARRAGSSGRRCWRSVGASLFTRAIARFAVRDEPRRAPSPMRVRDARPDRRRAAHVRLELVEQRPRRLVRLDPRRRDRRRSAASDGPSPTRRPGCRPPAAAARPGAAGRRTRRPRSPRGSAAR